MSDRPEPDPTTESQRFLQHRVAQFGKVGGLGGLLFWLWRAVGHVVLIGSVSGRSLVVDFAARGGTDVAGDRPSVTSTAPPDRRWTAAGGRGKGDQT